MRWFSNYLAEFRRFLQVAAAVRDLLFDTYIIRLYQPHGLAKRPWRKRLFSGLLRRVLRRPRPDTSFATRFRLTLERLGPTFVKLGQILSLREDMLPPRLCRELRRLQDNVPPFPYEDAKRVLESEFGKPLDLLFTMFEKQPIAAASLAQVHIGYLTDWQKVAVKIQRPGIVSLILNDLSLLKRIATILEVIPYVRDFQPSLFVDEFSDFTRRELDFVNEGKNADIFRENLKDDDYIDVPEVIWPLTSQRVLTLEFIHGIKPDDRKSLDDKRIPRKKLARLGAEAVLKQLYVHGFFHGDPHPGNLLIVNRKKFYMLDVGMTGRFTQATMKNMLFYYFYLVLGEFEKAADFLVKLTRPGPRADVEGFKKDVIEMGRQWRGAGFKTYSLGRLIMNAMNHGARYRLYYSRDLALAIKAIITIEAVGYILDPEMDLAEVSRPVMTQIFLQQFAPEKYIKSSLMVIPDYMDELEKLPHTLLKILEAPMRGELPIELHRKPVEPPEKKRNYGSLVTAALTASAVLFTMSASTPGPTVFISAISAEIPLLGLVFGSLAAASAWFRKKA